MRWKIATVVSLVIAVISLVIAFLALHRGFLRRFDTPAIVMQIKPLDQLTTVRYSIQRVVGVREQKDPIGEESLLLMVQGEVVAGVNLAELDQRDVKYLNENTVAIHLPEPKIFNAFLDEKNTKVWDRHITWWTPWVPYDPDLEHKARLSAVEEIRSVAVSEGILGQARKNAEIAVRTLLSSLGIQTTFSGS
jgi:Protein of unknown function (DUF4230)